MNTFCLPGTQSYQTLGDAGQNTVDTEAQVVNPLPEETETLMGVENTVTNAIPVISQTAASSGQQKKPKGQGAPPPRTRKRRGSSAKQPPQPSRPKRAPQKRSAMSSTSMSSEKKPKSTLPEGDDPSYLERDEMCTKVAKLCTEGKEYELQMDIDSPTRQRVASLESERKCADHYSSGKLSQTGGGGVNVLDAPSSVNMETDTSGGDGEAEISEQENEHREGEVNRGYIECVRTWERSYHRYRSLMISKEFRFVNLDRVTSFSQAMAAISRGVQQVLDEVGDRIEQGDAVQLRLEGAGMGSPFVSLKKNSAQLHADDFLDAVVNALQSNREIIMSESLRLAVTIIKPPRGGGRRGRGGRGGPPRTLKSIPYDAIIRKKWKFLKHLNSFDSHLCFAGGLLAVMREKEGLNDEQLQQAAADLHHELGWSEQKKVGLGDISSVENHLKINIQVVMYMDKKWDFFKTGREGTEYPHTYFMLLHNEHYYGVSKIKGFWGSKKYCSHCATVYDKRHNCSKMCRMCGAAECKKVTGEKKRCPNCCFYCSSKSCLQRHKKLACKNEIECISQRWCEKCRSYKPVDHTFEQCKGRPCQACGGELRPEEDFHLCYLEPLKDPPASACYIFYDFECTQESGDHVPNYLFAKAFNGDPEWTLSGKSWSFKGESCARDFVVKITEDAGFKNCTFIAHNAKAYDSYFIVKQLILQKLDPQLVTMGGKLMRVTLKNGNIKFIDSLNHLPMALAKLPKALGFEGCKGYFPHFFNTKENQNYVGPLPDPRYYGVDTMKADERDAFLKWYQEKKNTFDLQKELANYCKKDVEILEQACGLYREEIMKLTEKGGQCIDPLQYMSLAGACFAMYRFNFLPSQVLAIPPPDHYHRQRKRFSCAAIQWLSYIEHTDNISIKHALKGGEHKVRHYFLDGYAEVQGKKTAFEFNGCFWHGCDQCYKPNDFNKMASKTFSSLYNETCRKHDMLKKWGFEVRSIWGHEWNHLKETDAGVKSYLSEMQFPEPLVPRDAFFGGRTGATTLYYKTGPGEQIHYYDFTSLYPFVNLAKEYPVGHPTIITENFGPLSEYFGFAKVKLSTPQGLFFPVLPCKLDGKLVFTLCRTCAQNKQQDPCRHTDEERAISGTWCTIEIALALTKGYKMVEMTEVWHFEKRSHQIFAEYVKKHLRQKQEASGYPSWCKTNQDKRRYVEEYSQKVGVLLRQSHIAPNPSKRQVAKLFLNSLWGKFAQRPNLPNTEIVRDPGRFFELIFSAEYEPASCGFIDDEAACVSWKYTKERVASQGNTSVYIACFTTAYARLELYSVLDRLGKRCLYHDTDSVIFVSQEGEWNPPLGDYLGELTSELPPGQHITEFVSAGPKSYGYRLSGGDTCLKVKGITLNSVNSEKINMDSLRDLVFKYTSGDHSGEISLQHLGIVRDKKTFSIKTKILSKKQKVVYDKRVLVEGFKSLPYGY